MSNAQKAKLIDNTRSDKLQSKTDSIRADFQSPRTMLLCTSQAAARVGLCRACYDTLGQPKWNLPLKKRQCKQQMTAARAGSKYYTHSHDPGCDCAKSVCLRHYCARHRLDQIVPSSPTVINKHHICSTADVTQCA